MVDDDSTSDPTDDAEEPRRGPDSAGDPDEGPTRIDDTRPETSDESGAPGVPDDDSAPGPDGPGPGADQSSDSEAPLTDLAASVDERRNRERDPPDEELFSQEEVQEIDTDAVWDRLDGDESLDDPAGRPEVRVVEKDAYCERCPYFHSPPEVSCEHDGTEIVELVDVDHFRVQDCPKVRESERLEQL